MYRLSVLVSGSGTTLENILHHCTDMFSGELYGLANVVQVVADRNCIGLEVARRWHVPGILIRKKDYIDVASWSSALFNFNVDLHIFAGFKSKVMVSSKLDGRILNIHPSLLPAHGGNGMYGINVHEAVIKNKDKVSGCTVHLVDNEYDHGQMIIQQSINVNSDETPESLEKRIKSLECQVYPKAIRNYIRGLR